MSASCPPCDAIPPCPPCGANEVCQQRYPDACLDCPQNVCVAVPGGLSRGALAAGVTGGVLGVLALLALAAWCVRRRRRASPAASPATADAGSLPMTEPRDFAAHHVSSLSSTLWQPRPFRRPASAWLATDAVKMEELAGPLELMEERICIPDEPRLVSSGIPTSVSQPPSTDVLSKDDGAPETLPLSAGPALRDLWRISETTEPPHSPHLAVPSVYAHAHEPAVEPWEEGGEAAASLPADPGPTSLSVLVSEALWPTAWPLTPPASQLACAEVAPGTPPLSEAALLAPPSPPHLVSRRLVSRGKAELVRSLSNVSATESCEGARSVAAEVHDTLSLASSRHSCVVDVGAP